MWRGLCVLNITVGEGTPSLGSFGCLAVTLKGFEAHEVGQRFLCPRAVCFFKGEMLACLFSD